MKTEVTQTIKAPAEEIWRTISLGGDVHRWFAEVITTCDLVGKGEGAKRFCTMTDGTRLEERILEINHDEMRFRYAVETHGLPARNIIATINVMDLPDGRAKVTWGADYSVSGEDEALVEETIRELYGQGISALEIHHQQPA